MTGQQTQLVYRHPTVGVWLVLTVSICLLIMASGGPGMASGTPGRNPMPLVLRSISLILFGASVAWVLRRPARVVDLPSGEVRSEPRLCFWRRPRTIHLRDVRAVAIASPGADSMVDWPWELALVLEGSECLLLRGYKTEREAREDQLELAEILCVLLVDYTKSRPD